MRIGILGKGRVGTALASAWTSAGHDVQVGGRTSSPGAQEIADWAEVIVLAVPFAALEVVAGAIGPIHGKPVIDCTNPISRGPEGLGLLLGHSTSGAEHLQSLLPHAYVVKSLNQVGAEVLADPTNFALPPVQFIAGDDAAAKVTVAQLVSDLGFEPLDAGPLAMARLLEPFALVWINQATVQGKGRDWAFGAMPPRCDQVNEPVTVVVRRQVRAGFETIYENWLERLTTEASTMPGYLGAEFQKPAFAGAPYVSIFRFESLETLEGFEQSELRSRYLAEIAPHVAADAIWDKTTGLEVWFEPPKGTVVAQPSPHRMAIVLIGVVFALVLALNSLLAPLIGDWPLTLRLLLTVTLQVTLMTYIIMPRLTRLLARWIFPSTKTVT